MNSIGGEIAVNFGEEKSFLTDSGRSSLKLLLTNSEVKESKVLLPNFFCGVIEDVFISENINYEFYSIKKDLSIDLNSIQSKSFDALYLINFFGKIQSLPEIDLSDTIIIEDNVFFNEFHNSHNAKKWFAFNSLRKITPLTDGSLIKTNLSIDETAIVHSEAPFAAIKRTACQIKFEYNTNTSEYIETDYLSLFSDGENSIDNKDQIYSISPTSLFQLFNNSLEDQDLVSKRFKKFEALLGTHKLQPKHYSFYTCSCENKTELLASLRSKGIYLPNFWPKTSQNNDLYTNLVAIPLFKQYSDQQINYMFEAVKSFLKN